MHFTCSTSMNTRVEQKVPATKLYLLTPRHTFPDHSVDLNTHQTRIKPVHQSKTYQALYLSTSVNFITTFTKLNVCRASASVGCNCINLIVPGLSLIGQLIPFYWPFIPLISSEYSQPRILGLPNHSRKEVSYWFNPVFTLRVLTLNWIVIFVRFRESHITWLPKLNLLYTFSTAI